MCVCACCRFKSVLYELVGTLYKLLFFAFWNIVMFAYSWKKPICNENAYKIRARQSIVMTARNHLGLLWCIISWVEPSQLFCWIWHIYAFYVTAGMCSIMPFCCRINTYYSELCEHSFETYYKYLDHGTKTKFCSDSVSRFSKWNLIL